MKHFTIRVLCLLVLSTWSMVTYAQTIEDWQGKWDGTIEIPGMPLPLSIELITAGDDWAGTMDIPMQGVDGMALGELSIEGSVFQFTLPDVPGDAAYKGTWSPDTISGTFIQMGQEFPLRLVKKNEASILVMKEKLEEIEILVDSFIRGAEVPGMSLGIIYEGEELLSKGFGFRNVEEKIEVTPDTRFAIGSSTKAFTSMGLAMLVSDGKLDWSEPVQTYMPDFRLMDAYAAKKMTAVDLLTHNSGLPRHDLMWYGTGFSREELFNKLQYLEPSASFREKFQYQNLMYMSAGVLTERLTEQGWESFIQERIFNPLQMSASSFSVKEMEQTADFAYGYGTKAEELERLPFRSLDAIGPAGSINSSANDMLKWLRFQLDKGEYNGQSLVSADAVEKMHDQHMLVDMSLLSNPSLNYASYGLGWFIYDYDGYKVVEHGGNIDGFSALVYMVPEKDLGIVMLTNKNGTSLPSVLAYTITDILTEREGQDWYSKVYGDKEEEDKEEENEEEENEEVTTPLHLLDAYVGRYVHPAYGEVAITLEEGELVSTYYDIVSNIKHKLFDTFEGVDKDEPSIDPRFETDRNGNIIGLYALMDLSIPEVHFERLPDEQLKDPAFLSQLIGEYMFSSEMSVTISLEGGSRLIAKIPGQQTYHLEPQQGTTFGLKELEGFSMEFVMEEGQAVSIISHQPNGDFTADKKE